MEMAPATAEDEMPAADEMADEMDEEAMEDAAAAEGDEFSGG